MIIITTIIIIVVFSVCTSTRTHEAKFSPVG